MYTRRRKGGKWRQATAIFTATPQRTQGRPEREGKEKMSGEVGKKNPEVPPPWDCQASPRLSGESAKDSSARAEGPPAFSMAQEPHRAAPLGVRWLAAAVIPAGLPAGGHSAGRQTAPACCHHSAFPPPRLCVESPPSLSRAPPCRDARASPHEERRRQATTATGRAPHKRRPQPPVAAICAICGLSPNRRIRNDR